MIARPASSLPGIGKVMLSGSQLESTIAATGMLRRFASSMAIASLLVSMTNRRSGTPPMSLMPPSAFSSLSFSRVSVRRSFLVRPWASPASSVSSFAQALDRARDRLPVGQHAAEPAGVDVVLGRTLGRRRQRLRRLALGADEQHAPAAGDRVAHRLQRAVQHRHRLGEVDDVDVVAHAVDVRRHLRVPAMLLVAEVNASFEQLTHGIIGQCHDYLCSFTGSASAGS